MRPPLPPAPRTPHAAANHRSACSYTPASPSPPPADPTRRPAIAELLEDPWVKMGLQPSMLSFNDSIVAASLANQPPPEVGGRKWSRHRQALERASLQDISMGGREGCGGGSGRHAGQAGQGRQAGQAGIGSWLSRLERKREAVRQLRLLRVAPAQQGVGLFGGCFHGAWAGSFVCRVDRDRAEAGGLAGICALT